MRRCAEPRERARRGRRLAPLTLLAASCVAYDTSGPPVPSIDGTYATVIAVSYHNQLETRADTLAATLTLRDTHYRGAFDGAYRIADDSGAFAGTLRPEGTLEVSDFGAPPTPIARVTALREAYPWCDFARLGTGPLRGSLRGDSLLATGSGSLPCWYQLWGRPVEIGTDLELRFVGVR